MRRKRAIDPLLEEAALEGVDVSLIRDSYAGLSIGQQHRILEALDHARIYGARTSAVCEMLGVSVRATERWRNRRRDVLDRKAVVMARIETNKGKI